MVEVALDVGTRGNLLASSGSAPAHRDICYRHSKPGVGALIVQTHSTVATALSCLRRPIPAFHYMIAKTGGRELSPARYATYGTEALSKNALAALTGRRACLLANHGLVVVAADLPGARLLAEEVEALCAQYVVARSIGAPVLLSAREMDAVAQKFAGYGQKPKRATTKTATVVRRWGAV